MNRFIAKLRLWLARLAFWRKSAVAATEQDAAGDGAAAPHPGWLARLKHALRRRRNVVAEPAPDLDQTVVMERPSRERLDAAATEEAAAPKPSWLARLREKFRRQPKLPALEDGDQAGTTPRTARDEHAAEPEATEEAPKIPLFRRLLGRLADKRVWIPSVGAIVLALIGGVTFVLLQATHEKEKLQAELQKAQKKLAQQAAVVKPASAAQPPAAVAISPKQAAASVHTLVAATADNKPGINSGDCLITNKESVAANLKDCIDNFNHSRGGARPADKRP